ncbi:hypothetical protein LTR05_001163 [Lithohypha guttulata]|uniref:Formamidopyrimidine-DNA glycosylase catalytic domain-containing protein n=1 Tax=Lithohypha guttulata TaxID=1690604 RepID=A0AAN7T7B9_9EURO|nr:hypothetical protein LTR05_001163 [Lithohypha guttulata]
MPEIAEVARAVHYIRKHLVALEDGNVFGKVGTSHTEMMKHLTGKKVVDAGQQGKYFWMIMSTPPHPVIHFGMAGWLKFKSEHTFYYRKQDDEDDSWPPKYWKLMLETNGKGEDKIEAAYVDPRRFGRIRLVDCPAKDIRQHTPLVENGPDPVQDKEKVTVEWLKALCNKKKVPIKAMLLDQANISGIGNWVGDEIMYNAKMHPEQYANTLSDDEIVKLHKSIHYICQTAVDLLADSDQFPNDWLFKHRWGKGKKDAPKTLPNGEKIVFLTVGGRTSAVVPSIQKKTGAVAKEVSDVEEEEKPKKTQKAKPLKEDLPNDEEDAPVTKKTRGTKRVKEEEEPEEDEEPAPKKKTSAKKAKKEEPQEVAETNGHTTSATKRSSKKGTKTNGAADGEVKVSKKPKQTQTIEAEQEAESGRRRSGRLRK